jgi:hypothetical protein
VGQERCVKPGMEGSTKGACGDVADVRGCVDYADADGSG